MSIYYYIVYCISKWLFNINRNLKRGQIVKDCFPPERICLPHSFSVGILPLPAMHILRKANDKLKTPNPLLPANQGNMLLLYYCYFPPYSTLEMGEKISYCIVLFGGRCYYYYRTIFVLRHLSNLIWSAEDLSPVVQVRHVFCD